MIMDGTNITGVINQTITAGWSRCQPFLEELLLSKLQPQWWLIADQFVAIIFHGDRITVLPMLEFYIMDDGLRDLFVSFTYYIYLKHSMPFQLLFGRIPLTPAYVIDMFLKSVYCTTLVSSSFFAQSLYLSECLSGMKIFSGWHRFVFGLPLIFLLTHLFNVMELHKDSKMEEPQMEEPHKQLTKKFDHLVLGPAAGQGLSNRLQCQGTKALNRTYSSNSKSSVDGSITFVTVFTIYKSSLNDVEDKSSNTIVGNASYNKFGRSMALLNVFINFIQVTMPKSEVMILTDPVSDLSVRRNRVSLYPIAGEYSRDKLMLQRIRSYITFLETRLQNLSQKAGNITHYLFTDSDIAVVDDLGKIFRDHPNFHLALTFRNNKDQPLNSGFIAVRGTPEAILRAKLFLQEVLKVYSTKYRNASRMLGDQLALAWVVKSKPHFDARRFAKTLAFSEDIGGTSILFLPCALYNWTPPEGAGQFHGMPLDVKVVHFKGSRKRLMLESWNFYSSSLDISDMLCLVLGSGRTKYDF
ncbi:hypothetical protein VNO78_06258 [Psophocarpus tetragonolobus]|uniref:Uncharacterized protein n=1 Tax=Psophocarpus tetragonolobus TaxID=3891 RepID=A0AAN9SSV2_PSOTE